MLSFYEGEEAFFDAAEYLSSEEPVSSKENLLRSSFGYEIWLKEPNSVKERRENFFRAMGFEKSNMMGSERAAECSGAVSSNCSSVIDNEKVLVFENRELNGEANCAVDDFGEEAVDKQYLADLGETACGLCPLNVGARPHDYEQKSFVTDKKLSGWWKRVTNKRKGSEGPNGSKGMQPNVNRMKVRQKKKKCMELTALYAAQEIRGHEGFIWTMKFSLDGRYLASAGEGGVVRIWKITRADASSSNLYALGKFSSERKKSCHPSVVIPEKIFQIEELPLHEFHGHANDVLDLSWSKSNYLLSSSKDKTVRLWQVGCNECLGVFQHNDYVTCIQFNPTNENYFISGSIDGKVRIWGVSERRVVDWAPARDVVTAVCYHPDGNGFLVGSITGTCRFYGISDCNFQFNAEIHFRSRKKSSSNRITSIQFLHEDSQRVMIATEDSKVRILDGLDTVYKYKGLSKSGSQMSASFTSNGKHIVSVGENSRIYIWNYDDMFIPASKRGNSVRSCEHFFLEDVSLAIPWSGPKPKHECTDHGVLQCCSPTQDHQEAAPLWRRDRGCFSLDNWFPMDASNSIRSSATWPEERLPLFGSDDDSLLPASWGLVIVTAGWDGTIRTFHNYGLPIRI